MDTKENFKNFVKKNPKLIAYVKKNEMTWQKFYEIYDLYGEDENAWNEYLPKEEKKETEEKGGFEQFIKSIDLDGIQNGIESLQRVLGLLGDIGKQNVPQQDTYKPRPLYKHFED